MTNFKKDDETGEQITRLNSETGEMEFIVPSTLPAKSKIFRIPSSVTKSKNQKQVTKDECSSTFTTALLFLLPTSIVFNPIIGIAIVIIEAIIHMWAHRKNNLMKNKNVYYQSPLHIICKEFCGACKEEESKIQISKFLEKRGDKIRKYGLEYVKRIVM